MRIIPLVEHDATILAMDTLDINTITDRNPQPCAVVRLPTVDGGHTAKNVYVCYLAPEQIAGCTEEEIRAIVVTWLLGGPLPPAKGAANDG